MSQHVGDFELFTDGSCYPNPSDKGGGWAYILKLNGKEIKRGSGTIVGPCTNNRAELTAIIEGLAQIEPHPENVVLITSDSEYAVKGIQMWMYGWKAAKFAGIKNPDLWAIIYDAVRSHDIITAQWVRGHDGHPENEECDRMAEEARAGL